MKRGLLACSLLAFLPLCAASPALATGWLESGDDRLRGDLQWLVDAGVLRLPTSTWPLPLADLGRALAAAPPVASLGPAEEAALGRLRSAYERVNSSGETSLDYAVRAGRAGRLRDFGTTGREDGELELHGAAAQGRWSMSIRVAGVDASGGAQTVRLDNSHASAQWGNWILSFSTLDRYWGPGRESSLILSNAARPVPALVVDRAASTPFASPWLSWLGNWRLVGMLGQMSSAREDVERPLFFGLRATLQPLPWLELAISRTAQLCGTGRICDVDTFWDMLTGADNVGVGGNVSADRQPGNQLAGFDLRLRSPWRTIPVAIYAQDIGEDQKNYRPTDRMHLYGLEAWHALDDGAQLRGYVEYADTSCAANDSPPFFDCAYTNNVYFADGYRHRREPVGHTTDADSESRALGLTWVTAAGSQWRARVRDVSVNRGGRPDPYHSLSPVPSKYRSAELGFRRDFWGGDLDLQVGVERERPRGSSATERVFGMLGWRRPIH